MHEKELSKKTVAINMMAYEVATIVETTQERIDWLMNEFSTQKDRKFAGGAGKLALLNYLEQAIYIEDDFFNHDPLYQSEYPERWSDFLDDCVSYACLHGYMNRVGVPVIQYDPQWNKIQSAINILGSPGVINDAKFFKNGTDD